MRRLARVLASGYVAALSATVLGAGATAETFPDRLIRIIIPFAAGGPNDVIGRPLADKMSEILGQPIVIENRPGAAGRTATQAVARAEPDGYTLLMTTNSHVGNQAIYATLPYDTLKDFSAVTLLAENYGLALLARPKLPARTIQEFIAEAKKNPGKFTFAHSGIGNATHVAAELLQRLCGVELLAVPFKGTGTYISDLISDQIDVGYLSTAVAMPNVQSGLVKALATTGARRVPTLPDVPTFMEIGYPDYNWTSYYGLWLPAGTPRDRLALLNAAAVKAIRLPVLKRILDDSGLAVAGSSPEQFARFLEKDLAHQRAVVARIGLPPQ